MTLDLCLLRPRAPGDHVHLGLSAEVAGEGSQLRSDRSMRSRLERRVRNQSWKEQGNRMNLLGSRSLCEYDILCCLRRISNQVTEWFTKCIVLQHLVSRRINIRFRNHLISVTLADAERLASQVHILMYLCLSPTNFSHLC